MKKLLLTSSLILLLTSCGGAVNSPNPQKKKGYGYLSANQMETILDKVENDFQSLEKEDVLNLCSLWFSPEKLDSDYKDQLLLMIEEKFKKDYGYISKFSNLRKNIETIKNILIKMKNDKDDLNTEKNMKRWQDIISNKYMAEIIKMSDEFIQSNKDYVNNIQEQPSLSHKKLLSILNTYLNEIESMKKTISKTEDITPDDIDNLLKHLDDYKKSLIELTSNNDTSSVLTGIIKNGMTKTEVLCAKAGLYGKVINEITDSLGHFEVLQYKSGCYGYYGQCYNYQNIYMNNGIVTQVTNKNY